MLKIHILTLGVLLSSVTNASSLKCTLINRSGQTTSAAVDLSNTSSSQFAMFKKANASLLVEFKGKTDARVSISSGDQRLFQTTFQIVFNDQLIAEHTTSQGTKITCWELQ